MRQTLLIVDDDEELILALARHLSLAHDVVSATSPTEAYPHINAGMDVLLCDVHLAVDGESGLDVIRHAASAKKIPRVIAMSGLATSSEAFAVASAGALEFLEKPFSLSSLDRALSRAAEHVPALKPFVAAHVGARSIGEVVNDVRAMMVDQALARADDNQESAARILGITRQRVNQIIRGK